MGRAAHRLAIESRRGNKTWDTRGRRYTGERSNVNPTAFPTASTALSISCGIIAVPSEVKDRVSQTKNVAISCLPCHARLKYESLSIQNVSPCCP